LLIHPRAAATGKGLTGPAVESDMWPRTLSKLVEKAEQTKGVKPIWLRINAYHGLWQFTPWSLRSLAEKLTIMCESVRAGLADYGHLSGVVFSNGAGLGQGRFFDEVQEGDNGAIGLRRLLTPLRVRETLIIPLRSDTTGAVVDGPGRTVWCGIYEHEPSWLDWALEQFGLPSVREIFTESANSET